MNSPVFLSLDDIYCISNGLGARACQSYLLICKNARFSMGLQTDYGKVFTHSFAISIIARLEPNERFFSRAF